MYRRILAAIDLSDMGERIFEAALDQAQAHLGNLMLLHVLYTHEEGSPGFSDVILAGHYPELSGKSNIFAQRWKEFEDKGLEWLQKFTRVATEAGIATEFSQNLGQPGSVICQMARNWSADLIVIGSEISKRGELSPGGVSNYVMHHAPCSVLVVHQAAAEKDTEEKVLTEATV
ncbi:MAG: universal stress protein [Synechococcaceae cyanobacterium SM2_3_1]|nr:universal stress protein [Synechococcaceae cyanobacterium SM2_3_1]